MPTIEELEAQLAQAIRERDNIENSYLVFLNAQLRHAEEEARGLRRLRDNTRRILTDNGDGEEIQ